MIIYIDVLIFTNILINYCILSATKKFLHLKTRTIRLILSSTLGSLSSLLVFAPIFNTAVSILIKFAVAVLMCLFAFRYVDIKVFSKTMATIFTFSVIFCGVMILLYQHLRPPNMAIINDTVYFQVQPLILIAISIVIYCILVVLQRLLSSEFINTLVNLKITIADKEYTCIGKIDTGNSVVEPFSGCPVIITEKSILKELSPTKTRIVPYKALGHEGMMQAIKAQKVVIDNKEIPMDIYIGIYSGEIDKEIKAIINSQISR